MGGRRATGRALAYGRGGREARGEEGGRGGPVAPPGGAGARAARMEGGPAGGREERPWLNAPKGHAGRIEGSGVRLGLAPACRPAGRPSRAPHAPPRGSLPALGAADPDLGPGSREFTAPGPGEPPGVQCDQRGRGRIQPGALFAPHPPSDGPQPPRPLGGSARLDQAAARRGTAHASGASMTPRSHCCRCRPAVAACRCRLAPPCASIHR